MSNSSIMKKILVFISMVLLCTVSLFAQAPQKMAYQAIIRDANNKVVTDKELDVKITILKDKADGTSVYTETHTVKSTSNGVINLEVGGGESNDNFASIDWSAGTYFIQSSTIVDDKEISVVSQLLSTPYALYAEKFNEKSLQSLIDARIEALFMEQGIALIDSRIKEYMNGDGISFIDERIQTALKENMDDVDARVMEIMKGEGAVIIDSIVTKILKENGSEVIDERVMEILKGEGSAIVDSLVAKKLKEDGADIIDERIWEILKGEAADYLENQTEKKLIRENLIDLQEGSLPGLFSVSKTKKVLFSQGNLQYNPKQNLWRFAENQYDYIGKDNESISKDSDAWYDLFGYGTSGYNDLYPYNINVDNDFLKLDNEKNDWGVYNSIQNGVNKPNRWRTLSADEYKYLILERENADNLYFIGVVKFPGQNRKGIILFPDDFNFQKYADQLTYTNTDEYIYLEHDLWKEFEAQGAVFLPAAGCRNERVTNEETGMDEVRKVTLMNIIYWSSTTPYYNASSKKYTGYVLYMDLNFDKSMFISRIGQASGIAVRLVTDY